MKVDETEVRPEVMRSKAHHEELATPTPCAEESNAVVEWLGRWNGATDSPEKKSFKRVVVNGFEADI
jgi:hypothetical protein